MRKQPNSSVKIISPDNSIINTRILQELEYIMGGEFTCLIEEYLRVAAELLQDIGQVIDDDDDAKIREAAHALKSPSAQMGAVTLSKIIEEIETLDYSAAPNRAISLHKKAIALFLQIENHLQKAI